MSVDELVFEFALVFVFEEEFLFDEFVFEFEFVFLFDDPLKATAITMSKMIPPTTTTAAPPIIHGSMLRFDSEVRGGVKP